MEVFQVRIQDFFFREEIKGGAHIPPQSEENPLDPIWPRYFVSTTRQGRKNNIMYQIKKKKGKNNSIFPDISKFISWGRGGGPFHYFNSMPLPATFTFCIFTFLYIEKHPLQN